MTYKRQYMNEMAAPYQFSLVLRRSTSSGCRACRNPISSDQDFYTIVVRWEEEFNELDFCKTCYDNHIQKYFESRDFTISREQAGLLEFLSTLDA
jgi:anti-sigma-K factor RskA